MTITTAGDELEGVSTSEIISRAPVLDSVYGTIRDLRQLTDDFGVMKHGKVVRGGSGGIKVVLRVPAQIWDKAVAKNPDLLWDKKAIYRFRDRHPEFAAYTPGGK